MTDSPSPERPARLFQIPVNLDEWAIFVAELSATEEGVLWRGVRVAWGAALAGYPPGTLPDDTSSLSNVAGYRGISTLRRFFTVKVGDRLAWPWLVELHKRAEDKYLAAVNRGRLGGRPRKAQLKPSLSSAKAERKLNETNQNQTVLKEQNWRGRARATAQEHARSALTTPRIDAILPTLGFAPNDQTTSQDRAPDGAPF